MNIVSNFSALLCLLLAGAAQAIPVQELPAKSGIPELSTTAEPNHYTLSAGAGGVTSGGALTGYFTGGAVTAWNGKAYVSARGEHIHTQFSASTPTSDCCYANINEEVVTVGHALDRKKIFWLGAGAARVQRTKGEAQDRNFVAPGAVVELVIVTPLRHAFGGDFRLFANVNGKQNFFGAIVMARFGS